MEKTIKLIDLRHLPTTRDATEFVFVFSIVDSSLIGSPEEESKKKYYQIKVSISGTLEAIWLAQKKNLDISKILYEYGKRHLIKKLKEDTLLEKEEIWLTTASHPKDCPFDSNRITMKKGAVMKFELGNEKFMQDTTLLQLATSIIETRDYINSLFKEGYGDKLLINKEERDNLQFFKDATTVEEFVYRISALKNVVTNLNESILRKITRIENTKIKTISLLDKFLNTFDNYDEFPVKVFRNINRLRQGYPIHSDIVAGVQEAHLFFGFNYPISDYSKSWKHLLLSYLDSLRRIFDIISNKKF